MRIRSHCYHATAALAGVLLGCAEPAPRPTPAAAAPPPTPAPVWPQLATVRAWPVVHEAKIESGGHAGSPYSAELRVSPEARQAYLELAPGSELPPGSTVAEFHRDQQGNAGPIFVMQKSNATPPSWSFTALDAQGRVLRSGALGDCARCHAEAVADHLFGIAH